MKLKSLWRLLGAQTWFSVGARRRPKGMFLWFFVPFSLAVAAYVIGAAAIYIVEPWTLAVLFFSGMSAMAFMTTGATERSRTDRPSLPDMILAALSIAAGIYFALHANAIEQRIVLFDPLTRWDVFFATLVFALTIEIARRTTGLGLTLIVAIFVAYNLWGHLLGGVLQHGRIGFEHFIEIMVFTTDGVFGIPLRVAATYAFLFVMFGTLLQACRGGEFFFDFAAAISGRQAGGPAKVAVLSSGMYGMISGSPTSDVVTTGAITIPIMKRLGYSGAVAGAIEVAASTGGSLMPPVMGTAAFLMVDYTGIEYRDIAIAALIPALLYYVCIYSQVHFRSLREGFRRLDDDQIPRLSVTLKQGGLFFIPLAAITVALLQGYTPTYVAVVGSIAVLAVAVLRQRTRIGPIGIGKALVETCYRMVPVAGASAAAGLIIGGLTMTGLAGKFAHVVYAITDAQLFPTLVITASLTIVLGLGMPTPSAYLIAAALMAPILSHLGVEILPAHMFVLYYAVMSALTPPVAVAAYAASSIAEENPLRIAVIAVKLALAAFIVPFAFVYGPELLMIGSPLIVVIGAVSAAFGLIAIAAAVEGYLDKPLNVWFRIGLGAAGLGLVFPSIPVTVGSMVCMAILFAPRLLRLVRLRRG